MEGGLFSWVQIHKGWGGGKGVKIPSAKNLKYLYSRSRLTPVVSEEKSFLPAAEEPKVETGGVKGLKSFLLEKDVEEKEASSDYPIFPVMRIYDPALDLDPDLIL